MRLHNHNAVGVLIFPSDPDYPRLTSTLIGEIGDLLEEVRLSRLFRGVVLAANERSFATGAEVEEVLAMQGAMARDFAERGQELCERIAHFPLPVVAAIRGYCLGGGLDLALACHSRVATYDASFGHPGASLGLITGWGGTQRLPRLVGKATALHILLTAERIPATQALMLGLVDELASSQDLIVVAANRTERIQTVPGGSTFHRISEA